MYGEPATSEMVALGRLMLKFLKDDEVFVWHDTHGKANRLVIDGNIWGLTPEEAALVSRYNK
jgi:hypothetical protein